MSLKDQIYTAQLRLRQRMAARSAGSSEVVKVDTETFEPARVLFVLSGLIGDSVMSLPAIAAARRLWPKARITVLGQRHNRELIAACDFFDDSYECNADPFSLRRSGEIGTLQEWLNDQQFDAAFILLGDQYGHLLARAGIPVRVGGNGSPLENCLTHSYDIGSPRTWGANEKLNALRCLGYAVEASAPKLRVAADVRNRAKEILHSLGLKSGEDYMVIHPFGSTRRQWWKPDRCAEVGKFVSKNYDLRTVLIGGPDVIYDDSLFASEPIIDSIGRLSLSELLAVIEGSRLVVSTDSGPFHIAGALERPIVGLFRSRRPEHANAYRMAEIVFGVDDACASQCEWDRCAVNPCRQMQDIEVSEIRAAIDKLLQEKESQPK